MHSDSPVPESGPPRGVARELDRVGFYATANDFRAGHTAIEEVVSRLRRDARHRQPDNREQVLRLADELEVRS